MPDDRSLPRQLSTPGGIWTCKIGDADLSNVPPGADAPMREAVDTAFFRLTGQEPAFIFSGWSGELTEGERACVEDRLPVYELTDTGKTEALIEHAQMLAEALRLTQEYVGDELLPPVEGWSWFDALKAHREKFGEASSR